MTSENTKTSFSIYSFKLDGSEIILGSDRFCQFMVRGFGVSPKHASIILNPSDILVRDLGSKHGIKINGVSVKEGRLYNGTVLTIGVSDFDVAVVAGSLIFNKKEELINPVEKDFVPSSNEITIGRSENCSFQLRHPLVSRVHCVVKRNEDGILYIHDNGSTNGTFVNGRSIHKQQLNESDLVQIGPYRFIVKNGKFEKSDDANRIRLDARAVCRNIGKKQLLTNISLSVEPGKFVAVLGPSGAGKTTLARILSGLDLPDSGEVFYNGISVSKMGSAVSANVGYVSQHNLLRPELTVWETLYEQAVLRLPSDSTDAERVSRIKDVISMLDIESLSSSRILNLSGGEAKRVHLGIELISSPALIFLDEPLAGLDPGLIFKFMQLFKKLCGRGHTILLTTHTLEQIELCDVLLFVNSGKLIYHGAPQYAAKTLGVESIAEAYDKVRKGEIVGIDDTPAFDESYANIQVVEKVKRVKRSRVLSASPFKQFFLLTGRYLKVVIRDFSNLFLLLLQAPFIALLLSLVYHTDNTYLALSFYFCVAIAAIWIGGVNSIKEIAQEWPLFEREFRAGLSVIAYAFAKIFVVTLQSSVQALLFTLSLSFLFDAFPFSLSTFAIISFGAISGSILGLAVSSFSGNANRAVSMLPIIFIPQIFFSGILIPFDQMPDVGRWISYATISRPIFSMFKKISVLELPFNELTEWQMLLPLNILLIILIAMRVRFYKFFGTKTGR